jgi:hypothetical protein
LIITILAINKNCVYHSNKRNAIFDVGDNAEVHQNPKHLPKPSRCIKA